MGPRGCGKRKSSQQDGNGRTHAAVGPATSVFQFTTSSNSDRNLRLTGFPVINGRIAAPKDLNASDEV